MKSRGFLIFSVLMLIGFNSAFAQDELKPVQDDSHSDIFLVCSRAKDMRWLRAFKLDNGRCKTYYSKEGYVQVVSSASFFSSCEAVLNTVKKNIEEGGFKCKEQQLASMVEFE